MQRISRLVGVVLAIVAPMVLAPEVGAAEVSGRVVMPDVCAPEVSPAVVLLEPARGHVPPAAGPSSAPAEVVLVGQQGLQFAPRVQAVAPGQVVRFSNGDAETHNVHVISPGDDFNASMAPGQTRDFTPTHPGVVRLACDVHSHMRGYLVVGASRWVQACTARGRFRLTGVPDGSYVLTVWHEMGEPLRRDVAVSAGRDLDLGTLTLSAPPTRPVAAGRSEAARAWADVVDAIGMRLATALAAAGQGGDFKTARKHADDAYWAGFEAADMETAVRLHLGLARAADLERKFRAVVPALRDLAGKKAGPEGVVDATRQLLLALARASDDLNRKGVTDAAHLQTAAPAAATEAVASPGDPPAFLAALGQGLDGVRARADRGEADEAAADLTAVYFDEFEPVERFIATRRPGDVRPLEEQFLAIRGRVDAGLKGPELASTLDGLAASTRAALDRSEAVTAGAFAPACVAALVTIVREGVEVILLLAMLIALAARAGQPGALRAVGQGVVLAVLASAATAAALNLLVATAQGRTRERVEGGVMLAAAGVLFYVSYWLISRSQSKRWTDFLKRQATRGASAGSGRFALLVTAFLAVYREGAETALMFQALIGTQAGSRAGLWGLAAGLGMGVVVLAAVAWAVRASSVRLPLRAFFQVSGALLFAMAVVFAGNGVFELQSSGLLKTTPVAWLGPGLPGLGVHPSVQALSVQALLLAGAALGGVVLLGERPRWTGTAG
jgi:high-affinity iron transporter